VPAFAVTSWLRVSPFFSVNQESPFFETEPAVLQPSGPAVAGLMLIFSVFGLNPCHLAIERQMWFGVKQFFRAFLVLGTEPLVTSEKVCGPTFLGFCSECGSSLFWQVPGSDRVSLAAGCLDRPTGLETTEQIWVSSAGDYYALDERIPSAPREGD
jgi:hypothetical protein